ncbi:MAG TPA: amino acid adenylation domain-containing protein, partial [Candidatus Deferrimicrobium sp.]|nr:amino acid adenylation domain-containing protein [Candidatus Deferrimicrobium sp.]
GGAYIPLDREYPAERIAYILKDSAAAILLTGHEMKKMPDCQLPVVNCQWLMNASEAATFHHSAFELPRVHRSNYLAYIIYTSGSTGQPKGAMIEHAGMMNHIRNKIKDLRLNASGIVAQNASHTFDISVWQFFTSLSLGGRTVIYSGTVIRDPRRLLSQLVKDGVTILELVPSYLSMLLDMVDNPGVETEEAIHLHLNYLLVTGEEISPALVTRWFERFPLIKMVNAYGPTEASDDITHHIMDRALDVEHIPVGRPLKNVTIYIVDRFRQLCPIGVKGEIWVAGIAVGRGYLGDPERTEQAFAADPFTKGKNNRLYKTGDLGCWLPDGSIAFFGRKDYQVKIRGFRIETGEIESRLRRYEKIAQAVVTAGEDAAGHKHLIAYLVMKEPISPDVEEIKKYLQEHLPGYMIPSYFVPVQTIPLTANGKLDKKALPSLLGAGPEKIIPPRNDIEKMLVNTWAEALNIDKDMIGINTDFFHLGGHSLAMIRVMSLLSRDFEVSIDQLFKYPTIAGLAVHITYNKNRLEKEIDRVIGAIESFSARSLSGQGIVIPGADPLAADYEKYREKVNAEKPIDLSGTKHYTGILLTGATGFLGAHLLYELLNREGTHIYLPVRGSTPVEVAQRVASILSFYFGTEFYPRYKDRLTLFPSRLESENLGLDNESYQELAAKID